MQDIEVRRMDSPLDNSMVKINEENYSSTIKSEKMHRIAHITLQAENRKQPQPPVSRNLDKIKT